MCYFIEYISIVAYIFFVLCIITIFWWWNSNIVESKDIKGNFVIFSYEKGGYMGMLTMYLTVSKDTSLKIGYEMDGLKSNKFFIYGNLKSVKNLIVFSTFLGKEACRFIIFSEEKDVKITMPRIYNEQFFDCFQDSVKIKEFKPMFWQKIGKKRFSNIRIVNDRLIPEVEIKKEVLGEWLFIAPH